VNEEQARLAMEAALRRASFSSALELAMIETVVVLTRKMAPTFGEVVIKFELECSMPASERYAVAKFKATGPQGEGEITLTFPARILIERKSRTPATVALACKALEAFEAAREQHRKGEK